MNVIIVVPARETSSRLPGKHLLPLVGGLSLLETLALRISGLLYPRVLAAPVGSARLYEAAQRVKWDYSEPRVSENDVSNRVLQATVGYETILLVQGDSPCVGVNLVSWGLSRFQSLNCDFWENAGPSGFRIRIFKRDFLRVAQDPFNHEHVLANPIAVGGTLYVRECLQSSKLKFSIDTAEDLRWVGGVLGKAGLRATEREIIEAGEATANAFGRRPDVWSPDLASDPGVDSKPGASAGR